MSNGTSPAGGPFSRWPFNEHGNPFAAGGPVRGTTAPGPPPAAGKKQRPPAPPVDRLTGADQQPVSPTRNAVSMAMLTCQMALCAVVALGNHVWWLRWCGWLFGAWALLTFLYWPSLVRKNAAIGTARWRALRRIRVIETADLADRAPSDPAEHLAYAQGVMAFHAAVVDILADEERRVTRDLTDKTT